MPRKEDGTGAPNGLTMIGAAKTVPHGLVGRFCASVSVLSIPENCPPTALESTQRLILDSKAEVGCKAYAATSYSVLP